MMIAIYLSDLWFNLSALRIPDKNEEYYVLPDSSTKDITLTCLCFQVSLSKCFLNASWLVPKSFINLGGGRYRSLQRARGDSFF